MIAKLKAIIDTIGEDYCIIDVNGVGYLVSASSKTLARLHKGEAASLLIEKIVREDSISLFGFADAWEKEWFNTLTKVQGVGAKVCLSILSVLGYTHSDRINTMVTSIIRQSTGTASVEMEPEVYKATMELRDLLFELVYKNPIAKGEEGKAEQMLHMYTKQRKRKMEWLDLHVIFQQEAC